MADKGEAPTSLSTAGPSGLAAAPAYYQSTAETSAFEKVAACRAEAVPVDKFCRQAAAFGWPSAAAHKRGIDVTTDAAPLSLLWGNCLVNQYSV